MCGIAGELIWGRSAVANKTPVAAMIAAMHHRGPDAQAVEAFGPLVLGHARLSIIDLSVQANQPMRDNEDCCAIVFNGEIYNFQELRAELEAKGTCFRTASDTEVILEAYKAWGMDCLARFNGMFAFALWDARAHQLILARDRFGKKPLYYFRTAEGGIVFASELKALRRHPMCPREIDPKAVRQYFALNYCLTSRCILTGVEKVRPAHWLVFGQETEQNRCYWSYADAFRRKVRYRSEHEAVEALDALLGDAIRLRMISDVPLGAFLSGGIDSSTITALMTRQTDAPVETFSIGFDEHSYDESKFARMVAEKLGVEHRDRIVGTDHARNLADLAYAADEPFADTSFVPMTELCRFARSNVTVCLSGDGGDELFGGYETYVANRIKRYLGWIPRHAFEWARAAAESLVPPSRGKVGFDEKMRRFLFGVSHDCRRAHYSWRHIFTDDELETILVPERISLLVEADPFTEFDRFFDDVADVDFLDQAMYVDAKTWLVDDILVKVDRASMAHSLEVRAPLLDFRVAEFSAALPIELKIKGLNQKKYLLRREHARYLPAGMTPRGKRGFNAPVSHWLKDGLQGMGREATKHPLFDAWFRPGAIERLWQEHCAGRRDHGLKLFGLVCLGLWFAAEVRPCAA